MYQKYYVGMFILWYLSIFKKILIAKIIMNNMIIGRPPSNSLILIFSIFRYIFFIMQYHAWYGAHQVFERKYLWLVDFFSILLADFPSFHPAITWHFLLYANINFPNPSSQRGVHKNERNKNEIYYKNSA